MGKLIRMDLYRMAKSRVFILCLALNFALALAAAPLERMLFSLARSLAPAEVSEAFRAEAALSGFLREPFPMLGMMLALLSLCSFFYADVENGYIKNIAGQMPMKGFTVLSKFAAAGVHNVIFFAVGIIGNVLGSLFVRRIVLDGEVMDGLRVLVLKLCLLQSICAILLLVVSTLQSKSLGVVLAVLFGLGLTPLIYMGINSGLTSLFHQSIDISLYMPDAVMDENPLGTVKALLVSLAWGGVFLLLAVRLFDRKDV